MHQQLQLRSGNTLRSLFARDICLVLAALLTLSCFALGQAGHNKPNAIRAEKASLATNDATAVFGCETRAFDLSHGLFCYGPSAIRSAYGLNGLINAGIDGRGRTIVILDAYGSPTALADLQAFDAAYGLPNPSLTIVNMPGAAPTDAGWAEEVSLDLQWSHAVAPGANIVLVAAASNSDDDLLAGLNYAIDHHLGDVISMSFGESEAFLTDAEGQRIVQGWEKAFRKARRHHITLFVSSGDEGSTNTANEFGDVFPFQNVSHPASSPWVTGVGGTNLFFGTGTAATGKADPNGAYILETVWNDEPVGIAAAGGGGVSAIFRTPSYQESGLPSKVKRSLHHGRGVPDVAYNGGVVGGVIVHLGFLGPGGNGFYIFGGTSAGAPQWAGVIADINQVVHHSVGFINNRLYRLGKHGALAGLSHDVTVGDNGFCFYTVPDPPGNFACVDGFSATPGWDLATGWGTPNLANLFSVLYNWDDDDGGDPE